PPISPSDYSTARIVDVAHALEELARTGGSSRRNSSSPSGVDYWTRCFRIELVERPARGQSRLSGESDWKVLSLPDHPLRDALKRSFDALPGCGVVVALPSEVDEPVIELLLDAAREVFANKRRENFVLIQHAGAVSSFARTLYLEAPWVTTCVVNL